RNGKNRTRLLRRSPIFGHWMLSCDRGLRSVDCRPQKGVNAKDAKDSAKERNASLGLLDHIMILQLREGMIYKAPIWPQDAQVDSSHLEERSGRGRDQGRDSVWRY